MRNSRPDAGPRSSGCFGSRSELTRNVWAIQRQQLYPNRKAIARACCISVEAVASIVATGEGLPEYLEQGCLLGA